VFAAYADDTVFHYFGHHPWAGAHIGKPAAMAALREVSRRTKRRLKDVIAVMTGPPDRGCVLVTETMVAPGGETLEVERAMLYRVAAGQIAECWIYDQDQALIDSMINAEP
jgi:ketosteroid isomerase-like protein